MHRVALILPIVMTTLPDVEPVLWAKLVTLGRIPTAGDSVATKMVDRRVSRVILLEDETLSRVPQGSGIQADCFLEEVGAFHVAREMPGEVSAAAIKLLEACGWFWLAPKGRG